MSDGPQVCRGLPGALVDESSGCGRWTGAGHRGACGPPPGGLLPGARVAAGSSRNPPAPASKRLAPGGGDPLSIPGRRPTPTSSRTGGTGRRESHGQGPSCTPTRSGRCTPGANLAAPPQRSSMHSADQRQGRSHCTATEQADAPRPRLAAPDVGSPGTPDPSMVMPGRSPVTAPPPGRIPAAQGPGANPIARPRLIGTLPGRGHDSSSLMDSDPPPHPGRPNTSSR